MTLLEIDPNVVKPGWTPLIITIVLAAVMVFLFLSMRHQFRKISVPDDRTPTDAPSSATPSAGAPSTPASSAAGTTRDDLEHPTDSGRRGGSRSEG
ncbi:MAG: hypothetical protein JWN06_1192 [Propionibacteriaceae bacterium]|jgi:hypothetical protein|nr:hypothetical protein [Propionibacteriaceae bacterium]